MANEIKEVNLSEMLFNRDERLLDYITNLQEENERLKDFNIKLQATKDRLDKYDKENQTRIDKAVEYIEINKEPLHHYFDEPDCDYWIATNPDDLLDILRGEE